MAQLLASPQTEISVPTVSSPVGWVKIMTAGFLAHGSSSIPSLPGFPVVFSDIDFPPTVAGAAAALTKTFKMFVEPRSLLFP